MVSIVINIVIGALLVLMCIGVFASVSKDIKDKRRRGWPRSYAVRQWLIITIIIVAVIFFEWKI